jgi:LysM repeat protein
MKRGSRSRVVIICAAVVLGWAAAPDVTPPSHTPEVILPETRARTPELSLPFVGMYRLTQEIEGEIQTHSKKYGVDPELARAICMYESGGNENLTSEVGARGYFQVMPATFRHLGVRTNVEAGIKYYSEMLQLFGREDLALAAYNAGPGTVQRKRPMRVETLQYILGIGYYKNILRQYGTEFRAEAAKLAVLRVREDDTWWSLSERTDVPMLLLRLYNPFLAARPLRAGMSLAYPREGGEIVFEESGDEILYVARPGDHYLMLAFVFGVDPEEIRRANGLWQVDLLLPSMSLRIPPRSHGPWVEEPVRPGDDLSVLAARHGVSEWDLVRDNALWEQSLKGVASLRVSPQPPAPEYALYTVRQGDTLSNIADRHGVPVTALQSLNGLRGRSQIRTGQVLRIPTG